MTNSLQLFDTLATAHGHLAATLLADPPPHSHAVQFYEDEEFLFQTVGQFLASGLIAGDRLIVIASESHRAGFRRQLDGLGVEHAIASGQLTFADARETLATFMVGGMPSPELFRETLEQLLSKARASNPSARVRAFGEMVDLLWRDGNSNAAVRLEELWNDAGKEHEFSLLCAYVMGSFYREGDAGRFMDVCKNHSHVLPTENFARIDDAGARMREISVLQQRARALETEVQHRRELESALREALKERSKAEVELKECVKREQEARARVEASDAFKEVFLGILGHDLRNPLNTILTTVRLMTMRNELGSGSAGRLDRILSSGVRMQRMIEQILDVTRSRLATGITVKRGEEQALLPLVTRIVDELRAANPARAIDVREQGRCTASIDGDRFEQVVSNLVGNAVTHGDPERPIAVSLIARDALVSLRVHNYGPPIEPAFIRFLFDPFKRVAKPEGRPDGLGLGLYISERIITAHGGSIEVESCAEKGTHFEATFPRHP